MNTVVDTDGGFVLTATGNSYKKTTAATNVAAFRPYFTGATSGAPAATRSIVFVNEGSQNFEPYMPHDSGDDTGSLSFATGRHKIS